MKINLNIRSESATKKQMANAEILFGKNAKKVLPTLEMYSKEKIVDTAGLDALLGFLKSADPERVEKFTNAKASINVKSAVKKLSVAKQFPTIIAALKLIKPLKGYQTNSSGKKQPPKDIETLRSIRRERVARISNNRDSSYMAYNHNGTKLMRQPGTKQEAEREARDYSSATGNGAYVDRV
tara:strand:- start:7047 stop:7592 length:546 start_codon:yes stop_codon:yes gene_type:complete